VEKGFVHTFIRAPSARYHPHNSLPSSSFRRTLEAGG
jgi:hypothetical protein